MLNTDKLNNVAVLSYAGEISSCLCCKFIFLFSRLFKYAPGLQCLTKKNLSLGKRIRITKHLLQIHLLFAIWARLFLTHNAPSSNTKFMKSDNSIKKTMHGNYTALHSNTSNRIKWLENVTQGISQFPLALTKIHLSPFSTPTTLPIFLAAHYISLPRLLHLPGINPFNPEDRDTMFLWHIRVNVKTYITSQSTTPPSE